MYRREGGREKGEREKKGEKALKGLDFGTSWRSAEKSLGFSESLSLSVSVSVSLSLSVSVSPIKSVVK